MGIHLDEDKKYQVAFVIEVTGDSALAPFQNQFAARRMANATLREARSIIEDAGVDPDRSVAVLDPMLREGPRPGISSIFHHAYTWRPFGLFRPKRPSEIVMERLAAQEARERT